MTFDEWRKKKKQAEIDEGRGIDGSFANWRQSKLDSSEDIAPVATESTEKTDTTEEKKDKKWYQGWFQKGTLLDDGFQISDIPKFIVGTNTDVVENLATGVIGMGEKIIDAGASIAHKMTFADPYTGGHYGIPGSQLTPYERQEIEEEAKAELLSLIHI